MNLVKVDDILEKSHDVILEGGTKHRCFDTTRLFEIPTVNAPVWTPVEDGLPKEKGEYLVTVEHRFINSNNDNKDVVSYSVIQARFGSDWYFYSSYDDEYSDLNWYTTGILGIDISQKVIAWMPMPKPYKKGA